MNTLIQTRVTDAVGVLVSRRADEQGLSDAAYVRRLILRDLGLLEDKKETE